MTDENNDEPKIIVDEDWKSQVEAEKEQLKNEPGDDAETEGPEMPPASMAMLLSTVGTQALSAMGQLPDPMTGEATINKPIARHFIDTLVVLEEKTKGNLTDEEAEMLTNMLHQLRMIFVATPDELPTGETKEVPKPSTIELP